MRIHVRVIPNAKKVRVENEADRLKVYLTAPALEGKANKLLVEVLAEHFQVRKKQVSLIRGEKNRDKVIEISLEKK